MYLIATTKKQEKKGGKADAGKDKHAHVWRMFACVQMMFLKTHSHNKRSSEQCVIFSLWKIFLLCMTILVNSSVHTTQLVSSVLSLIFSCLLLRFLNQDMFANIFN